MSSSHHAFSRASTFPLTTVLTHTVPAMITRRTAISMRVRFDGVLHAFVTHVRRISGPAPGALPCSFAPDVAVNPLDRHLTRRVEPATENLIDARRVRT